jgi:hypothetical protein
VFLQKIQKLQSLEAQLPARDRHDEYMAESHVDDLARNIQKVTFPPHPCSLKPSHAHVCNCQLFCVVRDSRSYADGGKAGEKEKNLTSKCMQAADDDLLARLLQAFRHDRQVRSYSSERDSRVFTCMNGIQKPKNMQEKHTVTSWRVHAQVPLWTDRSLPIMNRLLRHLDIRTSRWTTLLAQITMYDEQQAPLQGQFDSLGAL